MDEYTNPWTTLSSQVIYDNPWIRVTESQVLTPGGSPGIYGVVHMKHRATGVVPIDGEGCTVLVGQYRYALGRYSWEIIEGGADEGEGFFEGARRELAEEAGLAADQWLELTRLDLSNSITDDVAVSFVAWGTSAVPTAPEDCEQLSLRRIPFAEAVSMAMDGRITDAVSVASLLKLDLMRRRRELPEALLRLLGA